jgi:hypothetical protein
MAMDACQIVYGVIGGWGIAGNSMKKRPPRRVAVSLKALLITMCGAGKRFALQTLS